MVVNYSVFGNSLSVVHSVSTMLTSVDIKCKSCLDQILSVIYKNLYVKQKKRRQSWTKAEEMVL